MEEANTRVFGRVSSGSTILSSTGQGEQTDGVSILERLRYACCGCGRRGRMLDITQAAPRAPGSYLVREPTAEEDLAALSIDALTGRLAALGVTVPFSAKTNKADLVGKLKKAGGSVEARERALPKLNVCNRCRHSLYCSRECQKAHWPMHKLVCKAPPPLEGGGVASSSAAGAGSVVKMGGGRK